MARLAGDGYATRPGPASTAHHSRLALRQSFCATCLLPLPSRSPLSSSYGAIQDPLHLSYPQSCRPTLPAPSQPNLPPSQTLLRPCGAQAAGHRSGNQLPPGRVCRGGRVLGRVVCGLGWPDATRGWELRVPEVGVHRLQCPTRPGLQPCISSAVQLPISPSYPGRVPAGPRAHRVRPLPRPAAPALCAQGVEPCVNKRPGVCPTPAAQTSPLIPSLSPARSPTLLRRPQAPPHAPSRRGPSASGCPQGTRPTAARRGTRPSHLATALWCGCRAAAPWARPQWALSQLPFQPAAHTE